MNSFRHFLGMYKYMYMPPPFFFFSLHKEDHTLDTILHSVCLGDLVLIHLIPTSLLQKLAVWYSILCKCSPGFCYYKQCSYHFVCDSYSLLPRSSQQGSKWDWFSLTWSLPPSSVSFYALPLPVPHSSQLAFSMSLLHAHTPLPDGHTQLSHVASLSLHTHAHTHTPSWSYREKRGRRTPLASAPLSLDSAQPFPQALSTEPSAPDPGPGWLLPALSPSPQPTGAGEAGCPTRDLSIHGNRKQQAGSARSETEEKEREEEPGRARGGHCATAETLLQLGGCWGCEARAGHRPPDGQILGWRRKYAEGLKACSRAWVWYS